MGTLNARVWVVGRLALGDQREAGKEVVQGLRRSRALRVVCFLYFARSVRIQAWSCSWCRIADAIEATVEILGKQQLEG